jgi:hypothetical protein
MLIEFLGDVPLASLDNRVLEKFITVTYGRTHSGAGLYYRTLKASFSKAVDWKYLNENPLKKVKMPKLPKAIPLFINSSELMKILEHTDNENLRDIFNLAFQTGMRLGEILNLRWNISEYSCPDNKCQHLAIQKGTCILAKNVRLTSNLESILLQSNHFVKSESHLAERIIASILRMILDRAMPSSKLLYTCLPNHDTMLNYGNTLMFDKRA